MRRQLVFGAAFTLGLALAPGLVTEQTSAGAAATCSPITTTPVRTENVPSPQQVLGYELGSREATDQEIGTYWNAVDRASDRVVTGTFAQSWQHRPLRYALVGSPQTLTRRAQISKDLATIREPQTSDGVAARLIEKTPDVLWITANVHGDEPSGGDAVLQLAYDLASRSDCVAKRS